MTVSDTTATVPGTVALPRARPVAHGRGRGTRAPEIVTSRRLAWSALATLLLAGAATVVCSGRTPQLHPDTLAYLPRMLAGPLGDVGPDIHLGGMIALFTVMCLAYTALVRLGAELPARIVVAAVVVLHVLVALGPPLVSTDVFSYGDYGRMAAIFHFNPYDYGPNALGTGDHWFPLVGAPWVTTPTAYGPLFTALSYLLAHLTIEQAALVYKLITVVSSLVAIAGVAKAAAALGRDVGRAVLLIGCNPVLIVYAVGGDHNDMIMLAALTWAVAALVGHRARTAGGLIVLSAAVKLTALVIVPFALVSHHGAPRPHLRRMVVGAAFVLAGVGILSTILFGSGPLHLLKTLEVIQSNGGRQSVPGFIAWGLGLGRLSHGVVIGLQTLLFAGVVGLLLAVRRGRLDWITATGWAIVALLVTSTFLLPWYVAWLLPFAALSRSRGLRVAVILLTAIGMASL